MHVPVNVKMSYVYFFLRVLFAVVYPSADPELLSLVTESFSFPRR